MFSTGTITSSAKGWLSGDTRPCSVCIGESCRLNPPLRYLYGLSGELVSSFIFSGLSSVFSRPLTIAPHVKRYASGAIVWDNWCHLLPSWPSVKKCLLMLSNVAKKALHLYAKVEKQITPSREKNLTFVRGTFGHLLLNKKKSNHHL